MTMASFQGFSKPSLVVFNVLLFFYHIVVPYMLVYWFVLYFMYNMLRTLCFVSYVRKMQKIFLCWYILGILSWTCGLTHFCFHAGSRHSKVLEHSFLLMNQASACPAVGARCYQLFCTIVEPVVEPPFDEHGPCSYPVY